MRYSRKSNHRTFRYSDEVAAILAEYNNDLDSLVLDAYYKLPELKEQIAMEQDLLFQIRTEALNVRQDIEEIKLTGAILSSMMEKLLRISRRMDDLAAGRLRNE